MDISQKIRRIQNQLGLRIDVKERKDFDSEEAYLMYLAMDPLFGSRTKKIAKKRLQNEYPNGLYAICASRDKTQYTIKYKYKNMHEVSPSEGEYNTYLQTFRAIVAYEVFDETGNKVLSDKKCRVTCGFDNHSSRAGEINLFKGLKYNDLSQEVREQILLNKLKEIIQIRLKLNDQKWSDFHEAVIEIEED